MTKRETRTSAFLDLKPDAEKATSRQLAYSDAPLTGRVIGLVDSARGLVEVQVDGSEGSVVALADAGLTYVGARVSLPRDSSGRITGVRAPSGVTPAGATVIPVGETGRQVLDTRDRVTALDGELKEAKNLVEANHQEVTRRVAAAETTVAGAQARADQVAGELAVERERVTGAVSRLGTVESSVGSLGERLEAAEADTATAKTAATQAQSAASQAQASADAADAKATQLQATADTAAQKADAAQSTADQAKTEAAQAAGIASGKSTVIIQSTAPAAALRVTSTLWIDTTGAANTPKRWNGTGWVTVSDKTAVDAASKAAQAQSTAEAAKADAAQARATADAAKTAASKAQATSDQSVNLARAAQSKADEGVTLAKAAQTQASSATTAAGKAQATADAAKASAAATEAKALAAQADAARAQASADAAVAHAPVVTPPWTSGWAAGADMTKTADAMSTSNDATGNSGRNQFYSQSVMASARQGRVWRFEVIVSAAADSRIDLGMYYRNPDLTYKESLWPSGYAKQVSAGLDHVTITHDFRPTFTDERPGFNFVSYVRAGGKEFTVHSARVVDVTDVVAAQATADQAVSDAAKAKQAADAAAAKALGAQRTADQAATKASTADGRYTVASKNPTAGDATGKPEGAVWEVRSGSTSLRRFVLQGSSWVQVKVGQDFVGENAIGRAQIADQAVGTQQVADSSITNAKVGDMNVDKLTVTGGARFPEVVLKSMVGDEAFIREMFANRMVVAAENMVPDPYFDRGPLTWSGDLVSGKGEPGHPYAMRMPTPAAGSSNMSQYAPFPRNWRGLMPVRPGVPYYAECSYFIEKHMPGVLRYNAQVYFYNADNVMVPGVANNLQAGRLDPGNVKLNDWNVVGGIVTPPPGSVYAVVRPTVYVAAGSAACTDPVYVGHQLFREAVGSTLIEPGSITTPHIATDAIDARTVNASSVAGAVGQFIQVKTDQITAGSAKIAGELIADDISGKTIRGSEIHLTDGSATSRKGIHLTLPGEDSAAPMLVFNEQNNHLLNGGSTDYALLYSGGLTRRHNLTIKLPGGGSNVIPIHESMSWDDLVAPPAAEFRFKQADMAKFPDSPSGVEASLDLSKASYKEMKNGIALYDGWAVVPIGRYFVEITTDWYWESAQESWAMSSAVWRMFNSGVDWETDPFATAKLIPGVTTRVAAMGTMSVAQTGYLRPAYWQNTGRWKPKACSFVIHRMVGGYQPLGVYLPQ